MDSEKKIQIYLREATVSDMELLYTWANEPVVRKNSFHTEEIPYEEHQKWFSGIMAASNCKQYILVDGEEAIGQIRVKTEGDIGEISYSVKKEKRCLGYGQMMLGLVREKVKEDFPSVKKIQGKVKQENIASQRAFIEAGFSQAYNVYEIDVYEDIEAGNENLNPGGYCS